jgi:hypothetical protein
MNLHSLQLITGKLHLRNGWSRYEEYDALQDVFWAGFRREVGGLSDGQLETIKRARILGLLLSLGLTSRHANESQPVPIRDDEHRRYIQHNVARRIPHQPADKVRRCIVSTKTSKNLGKSNCIRSSLSFSIPSLSGPAQSRVDLPGLGTGRDPCSGPAVETAGFDPIRGSSDPSMT